MSALLEMVQAAGVVAEAVKKSIRSGTYPDRAHVSQALTRVRCAVAMLANHAGFTLEQIRTANIAKLNGRAAAGTLKRRHA